MTTKRQAADTANQLALLRRADRGTFILGQTLRRARKLESLGLVTIEDNGSMRGRGMNAERWFVVATEAGRAVLAESKERS